MGIEETEAKRLTEEAQKENTIDIGFDDEEDELKDDDMG